MNVSGKAALVTGAANGIGRATAIRLAADGTKVPIVDLAVGEETLAAFGEAGGTAAAYRCDVSDE